MENEQRARWEERYRSGVRPWDTGITPPEVVDFWQKRQGQPSHITPHVTPDRWTDRDQQPGMQSYTAHLSGGDQQSTPSDLVLDIGCGTGTNTAYLAGLGLDATGVDLSLTALLLAQERRAGLPAGVQQRLHFTQADVSQLPFQDACAVYILDVGCFHALSRRARFDYTKGIVRNLGPGGYFHLYAFDRLPEEDEKSMGPRGLDETEVVDLFTPALSVVEIVRARPDRRPCRWYLLRKG